MAEEAVSAPRYRVAIDCDPGVDDALALLAALAAPDLTVDLVTTVAGNAPVEQTTAGALATLALAGVEDVPVCSGAARPLVRQLANDPAGAAAAPRVPRLPASQRTASGPALPALRAWLTAPSDLPKRLVALGPLTNLATLLQHDSAALRELDAVYVMGGSLERNGGRFSPVAETNFYLDPEAANIVMGSGARLRLFDYDATRLVTCDAECRKRIITEAPAPLRAALAGLLWQLSEAQSSPVGVAIHDMYATAGAAGREPDHWETVTLEVETGAHRGAVIAQPTEPDHPHAVQVARHLDAAEFLSFLTDSLWRLPGAHRKPVG